MRAALLAVGLAVFGFAPAGAVEPDAPQDLIEREAAVGLLVLQELETRAAARQPAQSRARFNEILTFYSGRAGKPVWIDGGSFTRQADSAREAFARAAGFGLDPEDYQAPDRIDIADAKHPAEPLARAEIAMTLAVVQYAVHAQSGRFVPQQVSEFLDPTLDIPHAGAILAGVERAGSDVASYLEGFHPRHPQFKALAAELRKIIAGVEAQRVVEVPAKGPVLKPGDSHADVALLRERLGAPANPDGNEIYDETLLAAVKTHQQRNGLQPDGVVGPATRGTFAQPAGPDRNTLIANMERWRWMPREMGDSYIRVNIPEFMVRVEDRGSVIFEERIIVGKPANKTPVFTDQMETVVLNPYWNVPGSIATKEILPIVRRNPSYLERNNLQVFIGGRRQPVNPSYVDWESVNPDHVFIRQPPGDDNALGKLKFLFPNKHAVYMHDTPTKHLFNQTVRAYSHGCVRVRNPRKFAEVLLRNQGWNLARIEKSIASNAHDINVQLETKLPVYLTYFTLWADEDGQLTRFRDIYGHDPLTLSALRSARS